MSELGNLAVFGNETGCIQPAPVAVSLAAIQGRDLPGSKTKNADGD
jgi:hypothetical protein